MSAEELNTSTTPIAVTIIPQPEFPIVDLTETNADQLELMLANESQRNFYHQMAETNIVFRALHHAIETGVSMTNEGATVAALSHGMVMFEAINSAVTSPLPAQIGRTTTTHLVSLEESVELMTSMSNAQSTSEQFRHEMRNTTRVVEAASERYFGSLTYIVIAGASVECQLTKRAFDMQFQLDHEYPQIILKR